MSEKMIGVTAQQLNDHIKKEAVEPILKAFKENETGIVICSTLSAVLGTVLGKCSEDRESLLGMLSAINFIVLSHTLNALESPQIKAKHESTRVTTLN